MKPAMKKKATPAVFMKPTAKKLAAKTPSKKAMKKAMKVRKYRWGDPWASESVPAYFC